MTDSETTESLGAPQAGVRQNAPEVSQRRSLLELAKFELQHTGLAHIVIYVILSLLVVGLPYSGSFTALWSIVQRLPALALVFAILSFALLYWANRNSLLWRRTLVLATSAQLAGLSALTLAIVGTARAVAGEVTISAGPINWRLIGDLLLQAQIGLPITLLLWRLASDKPKHAQTLRPLLARANASGDRLVHAAQPETGEGFNEALKAHRDAVKALGDAVPDRDVPAHPWERALLAQLKEKAGRAAKALAPTSLTVGADIRGNADVRNLIASWPGLGQA